MRSGWSLLGTEIVTAFPLSWPEGFPRTKSRETGKFKTSLPVALQNVQTSLRLFGTDSGRPVKDIVLSSNVTLGATRPVDPGVAAWFKWEEMQICIPVDRYTTVEANLQAIHHVLEARRVELRHGTLALVRAAFAGFKALPAPNWRSVLQVRDEGITLARVESAYKLMARTAHPDAGGDADRMALLNQAIAAARKELRGST
jgi:hypothetical protein